MEDSDDYRHETIEQREVILCTSQRTNKAIRMKDCDSNLPDQGRLEMVSHCTWPRRHQYGSLLFPVTDDLSRGGALFNDRVIFLLARTQQVLFNLHQHLPSCVAKEQHQIEWISTAG